MKKSEISQNVLQKSMTEKNDFLIFGRVKSFVGSSPSFFTPQLHPLPRRRKLRLLKMMPPLRRLKLLRMEKQKLLLKNLQ